MPRIMSNRKKQLISLVDYCFNRDAHHNTPFVIKNGSGFFIHNGREVTREEFCAIYPVPEKLWESENLDGVNNWK